MFAKSLRQPPDGLVDILVGIVKKFTESGPVSRSRHLIWCTARRDSDTIGPLRLSRPDSVHED